MSKGRKGADIRDLLQKISDYDADTRFMACQDLYNEMQEDVELDASLEQRICTAILERLAKDSSNDVIAVAVKCLSVFMKRAHESQVNQVTTKLSEHLLHGKEDLRDIYSIGLKTLVADSPDAMGPLIVARATPQLLRGITSPASSDASGDIKVKTQCMEVLLELLKRFGGHMDEFKREIMEAMLRQLSDSTAAIRKRATSCLGNLAVVLPDSLLQSMVETLLSAIARLRKSGDDQVRTFVQTIGTISRQVGHRLGRHLSTIVPLFIGFMGNPDDESLHTDEANELRENCLQAFESFVLCCPAEATPLATTILHDAVMPFLDYDPNYTYMEDDEDMSDWSDEEGDMFDSDADLSADDDDTSWKVRRACARVLSAVVRMNRDMLESLYETCADGLIGRFKDRADAVATEILKCFTTLVVSTQDGEDAAPSLAVGTAVQYPSFTSAAVARAHVGGVGAPVQVVSVRPCVERLEAKVEAIVREAAKQLGAKGKKNGTAKLAMWSMLRELARVLGAKLAPHIAPLLPQAEACFTDRVAALRLEALLFVRVALDTCPPPTFNSAFASLVPAVIMCADDDWYKITAEALRVAGRLACAVSPVDPSTNEAVKTGVDCAPYARLLFKVTVPRLSDHVDHEIKECAITASGLVLAHLGHLLGDIHTSLPVFVERLRSESTRLATIKALTAVSTSPHALDVSCILYDVVAELHVLLRQHSRELRQATLVLLTSLVRVRDTPLSTEQLAPVLVELSSMINDDDLQMCSLCLSLCTAVASTGRAGGVLLAEHILRPVVAVATSPQLQGNALSALLVFLRSIAAVDAPGTEFQPLLAALFEAVSGVSDRHAKANVARCIAAIITSASESEKAALLRRLLVASNDTSGEPRFLQLRCVGEVGRVVDINAIEPAAFETLYKELGSDGDAVKSAAAYAIGCACVGCMEPGLHKLLERLASDTKHAYSLLSALKVVVSEFAASPSKFGGYVAPVVPVLEGQCESKEEGVRSMAAECLGKLAAVDSATMVPRFLALLSSSSPYARWTVVSAVKHAAVSKAARNALAPHIASFLECLRDDDLEVRRAALLTLNALVHNDSALVRPLLTSAESKTPEEPPAGGEAGGLNVLSVLYYETVPRKELVREMDLGPFKHKVDDGLELRKAAFACLDSVVARCPERVVASEFLPKLRAGLTDHADVQMQCHQLLAKMCSRRIWQAALLAELVPITDCLDRVLQKMDKRGRGGKTDDVTVRSALHAIDALSAIPDASSVKRYADLLYRVQRKEPLASMLASIRAERTGARDATGVGAGAGAGAGAGRSGSGAGAGAGSAPRRF